MTKKRVVPQLHFGKWPPLNRPRYRTKRNRRPGLWRDLLIKMGRKIQAGQLEWLGTFMMVSDYPHLIVHSKSQRDSVYCAAKRLGAIVTSERKSNGDWIVWRVL